MRSSWSSWVLQNLEWPRYASWVVVDFSWLWQEGRRQGRPPEPVALTPDAVTEDERDTVAIRCIHRLAPLCSRQPYEEKNYGYPGSWV